MQKTFVVKFQKSSKTAQRNNLKFSAQNRRLANRRDRRRANQFELDQEPDFDPDLVAFESDPFDNDRYDLDDYDFAPEVRAA